MSMTICATSELKEKLLGDYQHDFPLVREPFGQIAKSLCVREEEVICCFAKLQDYGIIGRIGGAVRPNTLGASTLAAMSVADFEAGGVAEMLAREAGVNHVYLRENRLNLWFVATGPDRSYIDATLRRLEAMSGHAILDLRLERSFHIDLGFPLSSSNERRRKTDDFDVGGFVPETYDRALVQVLASGLPIVSRPFRDIGARLGIAEDAVIERLSVLLREGIVTRIGVIVRHRALGWSSNAMVTWDVDPDAVEEKGQILAQQPGVNLCYRRTRYERQWPYNLYCMIHARSRPEALKFLETATRDAELEGVPREILFSSRCYKQTGALIDLPREAA